MMTLILSPARVGPVSIRQTVRMVFELKQNIKPQLFAPRLVAGFKNVTGDGSLSCDRHRCSGSAAGVAGRLQQRAISTVQVPPAESGRSRVKPGATDPCYCDHV